METLSHNAKIMLLCQISSNCGINKQEESKKKKQAPQVRFGETEVTFSEKKRINTQKRSGCSSALVLAATSQNEGSESIMR